MSLKTVKLLVRNKGVLRALLSTGLNQYPLCLMSGIFYIKEFYYCFMLGILSAEHSISSGKDKYIGQHHNTRLPVSWDVSKT